MPILTVTMMLFAACSDGSDDANSANSAETAETGAPANSVSESTEPTTTAPQDATLDVSLRCDPLDERACLLPWPNDAFTVPDEGAVTGRRLDIHPESPPSNVDGVPIDVTDQNRADGFSPGSAILALVPALDVEASGIVGSDDIGGSLADDAPIVLLDTTAGERVPYWAELDAPAPEGDQLLMVHPAVSLLEGHHFVVALRNLKEVGGTIIEPSTAFEAAVSGTPEPLERAQVFRELLAQLATADVTTDGLYLAWDFTVASAESLSGRLLSIHDQAYETLGDGAPAFKVTSQTDSGNVRTIDGTFEVPNFLTADGSPGNTFMLGPDGLPMRNEQTPDLTSDFHCVVPVAPPAPVPGIVYGHGLLGSRSEVDALSFAAEIAIAAPCATDEIGMSSGDIATLASILADLSDFNQQADRLQQGLLNQQYLGRLLNSGDGFISSPAFRTADGAPIVAIGDTQFVGNSQGGILGGAASAISTEWSRVVLGVPGSNYSLLLPRSSDWPQFQVVFDAAYTNPIDRALALQLIQLLWDRGENNGYAQHLTTDPYEGIDAKQVLMVEAFGDHQVANVSTEVLARTLGAAVHAPVIADGRSTATTPMWNIAPLDPAAPPNAILVLWDFGTPAPPSVNLPPTEPEYGRDPHGAGSDEPLVLQQALTFLLTGEFTDLCNAGPCQSTVLTG